jgi:hypothetical protein
MRREPDFFGDRELILIHIAKRLREALKIEKLLAESGVDYLVEPDRYAGGIIFRTERVGAFFYVAEEAEQAARGLLSAHGYRPHQPLAGSR